MACAETRRRGLLRRIERTLDLALQELHRILGGRPFRGEAAHLAPEAPLARRDNERRLRRDIEHPFQLVLLQMNVVQQDERLLLLEAAPDLRLSRLAGLVAFVEGLEEELQEVFGRLMPSRHVDDAVNERGGSGMIGEVAENRGLADAGLAACLDWKAGVECREGHCELGSPVQQASNQLRAEENRRGPGTNVRALGAGSLTDNGAARFADLQNVSANRYLPGDRAVHRQSLNASASPLRAANR